MRVSTEVLTILDRSTISGNALHLPNVRLDRKLYETVNKVLVAAGGKWNRKAQAHLFDGDAAAAIEPVILTGQVVDARQEYGYFPTPPPIVEQMILHAGVWTGAEVLEPSAGRGAIAGPLAARGAIVDCIELLPKNADVITGGGYAREVTVGDFLTVDPSAAYDLVLMNPPFARQADITHVRHALRFLRPDDGLLVAIMSAGVQFRENAQSFRDLVHDRRGDIEALPDDSFKESGTGVRTVLVTIPADA
jgi:predicted RNA methylase